MDTVAGVFHSRADAERAIQGLRSAGIAQDRIAFLTPGTTDTTVEAAVPTSDTEQPGMGAAMGGTVGGAMGVAGGATLGVAAASLLIPGVGPVIAGGIIGAALLGIGGAVTGAAAGAALEEELAEGIPHDELYVYEDALRKGRSVAIAFVDDDSSEIAHNVMAQAGAESVDAAREDWWLGLRDVEEESYRAQGGDFASDELAYRSGFEAALHPKRRGKAYEECRVELLVYAQEAGSEEAYRQGFKRGQEYLDSLKATPNS
jgi:hypothetical protein